MAVVLFVAGFAKVKDTLVGGGGELYAKLGFLMFAVVLPGAMVELGLVAAAADTAAIAGGAGMSTAAALWAASQGVGTVATVIPLIGLGLIGIAMVIQKNYHVLVGILLIITGVLGATFPVIFGYDSPNMFVVWIALTLSTIITGIVTIRSTN